MLSPLVPFLSLSQCQQYRERTSVLENQPAGTFVLQVHAADADEGANGKVTYGFMHKDSTIPAFSIHPDTGALEGSSAISNTGAIVQCSGQGNSV